MAVRTNKPAESKAKAKGESKGESKGQDSTDQKPIWKKITRGTLYPFSHQRNRRVKPNEKLQASEEEIAKYRDHFELIKDGTGKYKVKTIDPGQQIKTKKEKPTPEKYELVPIGDGLYDVESPSGKKMNDQSLDREGADALIAELDKETSED
jgi:hypothetical protein